MKRTKVKLYVFGFSKSAYLYIFAVSYETEKENQNAWSPDNWPKLNCLRVNVHVNHVNPVNLEKDWPKPHTDFLIYFSLIDFKWSLHELWWVLLNLSDSF